MGWRGSPLSPAHSAGHPMRLLMNSYRAARPLSRARTAREAIALHCIAYYDYAVILSWRNTASRKVWEGERPNQFRGLDVEIAIDLLLALNVAKSLHELSPLKSVGLHKLKGERKNQSAMTVNDRWRICFQFRKGDAFDVEIADYHRG